jgi:hypothetical protein
MEKRVNSGDKKYPKPDNRKPYVIRGHHWEEFAKVIRGVRTAKEEPVTPYNAALNHSQYLRQQKREVRRSEGRDSDDYRYLTDVVGSTWVESQIVRYREQAALTRFLTLEDDHPVEFTAGRVDDLCKTCIHGKHCTIVSETYGAEGSTRLRRDSLRVDVFIREARRLGFEEDVLITKKLTEFTDTENFPATTVITSAGTFKEVVKGSKMFVVYPYSE